MAPSPSDRRLLALVRRLGVVRPRDLKAHGFPRAHLYRLADKGLLERQARGLYTVTHHPFTENHALVLVAKRVPDAVICLLTALRFHDLTTQLPWQVWIALPEKARFPKLDYPPVRVIRFSGAALIEGVETHLIEGVTVRVYSPAKTVADCFKHRNKVGVDVAIEALKDFTRDHRGKADELARFAQVCRVRRIMQPYLDAIV